MSMAPVEPSDKELEGVIIKMGVDAASVVRVDHTVCVSLYRKGGVQARPRRRLRVHEEALQGQDDYCPGEPGREPYVSQGTCSRAW